MKNITFVVLLLCAQLSAAQTPVDLSGFKKNGTTVSVQNKKFTISWPSGKGNTGRMILDLHSTNALFNSIQLSRGATFYEIAKNLDPAFILRVGKRTLSSSSGGWDVFFDKVPTRPYKTYALKFDKKTARIKTEGSRTVISISNLSAPAFKGTLEIILYNGSPLFNVSANMTTLADSTAILYDAGLVSKAVPWKSIAWSDTGRKLLKKSASSTDSAQNLEVKYRTVIGENPKGSLVLFPAPHQYFYPLDEAFNLKFTWFGNDYLKLLPGYGIGIRQDPIGDKRYVPWFNAPPETVQRLNFFCLLSAGDAQEVLTEVKKFTHYDSYASLAGYKRMASHFHNEFISDVVLSGKAIPEKPEFVEVLKDAGLDIVKLAEFHGPGHPKGPDSLRLKELSSLFEQTKRLSDQNFSLLPGEEANNFYGGHWLAFFPKPVYWVMSRRADQPFVVNDPKFGKVYHVGDKTEMQKLLETENGLAWVAHARTKASTGYPDKYKEEDFFKSDTYLGAAWKAILADLSLPSLSKRVLNLMDDMANWGLQKHVISEADIFTITHQNEMYAHLNVNYLQMDKLPEYKDGWKPVLDVLREGKFFVSTGEVQLPAFSINGKTAGQSLNIDGAGKGLVKTRIQWTYPLSYVEIVSGDGNKVVREKFNLNQTQAFGNKEFVWNVNLRNRKWVRMEVWDVAANGAFTQMIWLK